MSHGSDGSVLGRPFALSIVSNSPVTRVS